MCIAMMKTISGDEATLEHLDNVLTDIVKIHKGERVISCFVDFA